MTGRTTAWWLRRMTADDVPAVVAVEEPASVVALATVFPQDRHPFPREAVAGRWLAEVHSPDVDCHVVLADDVVAGFVAVRGDELLHLGVALDLWGSGLAGWVHDEALEVLRARGHRRAWLRVFTGNGRARAFYARRGWRETGVRSTSLFAPHPELRHLEREVLGVS